LILIDPATLQNSMRRCATFDASTSGRPGVATGVSGGQVEPPLLVAVSSRGSRARAVSISSCLLRPIQVTRTVLYLTRQKCC
jgi:hypothetical protein